MRGELSFIETQFPVSKISKESYKERMANYSQTLTGLGKWWGRKPLVLVRATILGLLLPASDDPVKDREIFLKLMTMDDEGLWLRKKQSGKKITAKDIVSILTDEPHQERVLKKVQGFVSLFPQITHDLKSTLYTYIQKKNESYSWIKGTSENEKEAFEKLAFQSLYYDEKLDYCVRPEHVENLSPETWKEINTYLKTNANSLPELIEELGKLKFGHRPKVGDAFCGGGSIPFEAARMGCDVYASDLNPVAALLTWAALHIVGGGETVAQEVRKAQEEIYKEVDRQVTEWGIEHNEENHRADAYLYCVEVEDPDTGWKVPLAPSWVIGEKTKTVAILHPDEKNKRYDIEIKMNASETEMKQAKAGTVKNNYVVHPKNPNPVPMSLIRRENRGGLRLWEKEDILPREGDVFQERLYCIRYVAERDKIETKSAKNSKKKTPNSEVLLSSENSEENEETSQVEYRYYTAPTKEDLKREEKVYQLLRERFADWQEKGYVPSKKIEEGAKTSEPIRTRGWAYWHQLFNPRQLLVNGLYLYITYEISNNNFNNTVSLLRLGSVANWNSKLCQFGVGGSRDSISQTFYNQALNTLMSYATRTLSETRSRWVSDNSIDINLPNKKFKSRFSIDVRNIQQKFNSIPDFWITDPPYADAVVYHELTEFFLAWYEKHIPKLFPEWYTDSKRSLAIKGEGEGFRRSMVEAYKNLADHMPDNGMQVVMFTHQDAGVWADLAIILWASGLRVTSAWTIATETTSELKKGNYVQGTVLLVLRKNISTNTAFLDELIPEIEDEVKRQVDSMMKLDDKEEPNFGDTDYQLAAYAAALRVLTSYKNLGDINVERELSRNREKSPLEDIIENAKTVAANYLIPDGISKPLWMDLSGMERYYIKGLDMESRGENTLGAFQELARGYGIREYESLMHSLRANDSRAKTPMEFGSSGLGDEGFGSSPTRYALYAIHSAIQSGGASQGRFSLQTEMKNYRDKKSQIVSLLRYFSKLGVTLDYWKIPSQMANLIAGLVEGDRS